MLSKNIDLYNCFNSSSLITRKSASIIFDEISKIQEDNIILDFHGIKYTSRSFLNELISKDSKFHLLNKNVDYVNMSSDISKLYNLVKNSSGLKSSVTYPSLAKAKTITI